MTAVLGKAGWPVKDLGRNPLNIGQVSLLFGDATPRGGDGGQGRCSPPAPEEEQTAIWPSSRAKIMSKNKERNRIVSGEMRWNSSRPASGTLPASRRSPTAWHGGRGRGSPAPSSRRPHGWRPLRCTSPISTVAHARPCALPARRRASRRPAKFWVENRSKMSVFANYVGMPPRGRWQIAVLLPQRKYCELAEFPSENRREKSSEF